MKIIICFAGKPGIRGYRVRDFHFDPELGVFVWQKRRLTPEEFNTEAQKVFELNADDLHVFARVLFEKGDGTESGKVLELQAKVKELTDLLLKTEGNSMGFQADAARLKAAIGKPPEGSHPDEAVPRSGTWHEERLSWMGEVESLRKHNAELVEKLKGMTKAPSEAPFVRPSNSEKRK